MLRESKNSVAAQILADCWFAALGYRPTGPDDTLRSHGAGSEERIQLTYKVRDAFGCHLHASLFRGEIPFHKTVNLLETLAPQNDASGPAIYLAPGRSGIALSELLLARDYPGPGRIHLIHYPPLSQMASSRQIVPDLVNTIVDQLPPPSRDSSLFLAGYSLGAHLVLEAACKLSKAGRPIKGIILINSVAFPRREHLQGMDRRFYECRTPKDFAYFSLWKLSGQNCTLLQSWSGFLQLMKKTGLAELSDHLEAAVSGRVVVKAALNFQCSRYPDDVCLLRPSKSPSEAVDDAGWSALSTRVHVSSFPFSANDFLKSGNRSSVTNEIARLVGGVDAAVTNSCQSVEAGNDGHSKAGMDCPLA